MVLNLINGIIPKTPSLEGFQPAPSQAANEFMSMQGGQMALYFGAMYSVGKRMIAALDNEDFNAMVKNPKLFVDMIEYRVAPIQDQFIKKLDSEKFLQIQNKIIDAGIDLEKRKLVENINLIKWFLGKLAETGLTGLDALATALGIPTQELKDLYKDNTTVNVNSGGSIGNHPPVPNVNDPSKPPSFTNPPASNVPPPTPTPTPSPTPTPTQKTYKIGFYWHNHEIHTIRDGSGTLHYYIRQGPRTWSAWTGTIEQLNKTLSAMTSHVHKKMKEYGIAKITQSTQVPQMASKLQEVTTLWKKALLFAQELGKLR